MPPHEQRNVLGNAGLISRKPTSGVTEEGCNSDAGANGGEVSRPIRSSLAVTLPVLPPATCPGPRRPLDAMPFGGDLAKSEDVRIQQRISDGPAQASRHRQKHRILCKK